MWHGIQLFGLASYIAYATFLTDDATVDAKSDSRVYARNRPKIEGRLDYENWSITDVWNKSLRSAKYSIIKSSSSLRDKYLGWRLRDIRLTITGGLRPRNPIQGQRSDWATARYARFRIWMHRKQTALIQGPNSNSWKPWRLSSDLLRDWSSNLQRYQPFNLCRDLTN